MSQSKTNGGMNVKEIIPTKERWERSLYLKGLALELVCPVINARKEFEKDVIAACKEDGDELDPKYYIDWALQQAEDELVLEETEDDDDEEDEEETE